MSEYNFSGMIRDGLFKKGMSQKELAEKIHVTEVAVSRYVNGIREPKGAILLNIANALEISLDDFLRVKYGGSYD